MHTVLGCPDNDLGAIDLSHALHGGSAVSTGLNSLFRHNFDGIHFLVTIATITFKIVNCNNNIYYKVTTKKDHTVHIWLLRSFVK
jgi:hypothetical protein